MKRSDFRPALKAHEMALGFANDQEKYLLWQYKAFFVYGTRAYLSLENEIKVVFLWKTPVQTTK